MNYPCLQAFYGTGERPELELVEAPQIFCPTDRMLTPSRTVECFLLDTNGVIVGLKANLENAMALCYERVVWPRGVDHGVTVAHVRRYVYCFVYRSSGFVRA